MGIYHFLQSPSGAWITEIAFKRKPTQSTRNTVYEDLRLYSHYVIEHRPDNLLGSEIQKMFRRRKCDGVIRIGGANAESAARKLVDGDTDWFDDFFEKRTRIGGRFANSLLRARDRRTILTSSYIQETDHPDIVRMKVRSRNMKTPRKLPMLLSLKLKKTEPSVGNP